MRWIPNRRDQVRQPEFDEAINKGPGPNQPGQTLFRRICTASQAASTTRRAADTVAAPKNHTFG
jgi:hypothetical protein